MTNITQNLTKVNSNIDCLCSDTKITLVAVSKKKPIEDIKKAFSCGQLHFAENYVSEAKLKISTIKKDTSYSDIVWHFIGSIQSNKAKYIANNFSWVQSVDRIKIAKILNSSRDKNLGKLNICLQVNIDNEINKSSVAITDIDNMINAIYSFDMLHLRGFMCIPKKIILIVLFLKWQNYLKNIHN